MTTVSMFDVIAVTGTSHNGSRFCLVCSLGSAPVMVAFVQPSALDKPGLLEALQVISDTYKLLQVVVVCLAAPSDALEQKLREIAEVKKLRIPLAVLPNGELPASLPVNPSAENTVLLYRGRRIRRQFENVDLTTFDLANLPSGETPVGERWTGPIEGGAASLAPTPADNEMGKVYGELNEAAADLVSGL